MKTAVPMAYLVLYRVLRIGGVQDPRPGPPQTAHLSVPIAAIVEHVIGWLHDLTASMLDIPTGGNDRECRLQRRQRNNLIGHLADLRDGLARARAQVAARLEGAAEYVRLEREREQLEADARADALAEDQRRRSLREGEEAAERARSNAQHAAFVASTHNFGPDPMKERRLRIFRERMKAFNRAAASAPAQSTQASTTVRSSAVSASAEPRGPSGGHVYQQAGPGRAPAPADAQGADWEFQPEPETEEWEPTAEEKQYILSELTKLRGNQRFSLYDVATKLQRTVPEVKAWKRVLVDRAVAAYYQKGYSVDQMPDWLSR
jgi:hypothetical protein